MASENELRTLGIADPVAVAEPDGKSPDWVILHLSLGSEPGPAIDRMQRSVANYQRLSAMIGGALFFAASESDERRLSEAHELVIDAWTKFVDPS